MGCKYFLKDTWMFIDTIDLELAEQKPASLQFRALHSAQCAFHCADQNWPVVACSTVVDGAAWNAQENAFIK